MAREDVQTKGRRYVVEGRLLVHHVDSERVEASCRGQGAMYRLGCDDRGGWWCNCPARTRCSHLVALQLVTISQS
jgi:uncharacterized Zn finger protein